MPNKPRPVSDFGLDLIKLVKNSRREMRRESRGIFIVDLVAVISARMLAQIAIAGKLHLKCYQLQESASGGTASSACFSLEIEIALS
jgi:hypothetical protein